MSIAQLLLSTQSPLRPVQRPAPVSPPAANLLPMKTAGTHHFLERTYREGSAFQWVRETLTNALEAQATRVQFAIEWQAVQKLGVYRRVIADNGKGMTADQLVAFFNTFGAGSKTIGGIHENFGVGAKTSLLPWNPDGVVVISWVNGQAAMIWVARDPSNGEYGLKVRPCDGPQGTKLECAYAPYDDAQHGCDWSQVKPAWIRDHGTVIVLLGTADQPNTVLGDPRHHEADLKGISRFLNRRMWQLPARVTVSVEELRGNDWTSWPKDAAGAGQADSAGCRTNVRKIEGARHFIDYPHRSGVGRIAEQGTVDLSDGTRVHWYLWDGARPKVQSYAALNGYVAVRYNNELYDITSHPATYRAFGVSEGAVRNRLWLIVEPPVDPTGQRGVYPKTDRNSLLLHDASSAGLPLPLHKWAEEFAANMPDELEQAIADSHPDDVGRVNDPAWREKLAGRFGARWRIALPCQQRGDTSGLQPVGPSLRGYRLKPTPPRAGRRSLSRALASCSKLRYGTPSRMMVNVMAGLPSYRRANADDVGAGMLAAWHPRDLECAEGVVLLNVDHPVLRSVIGYWQERYAPQHSAAVEEEVIAVYGEVAASKVAHSECLKALLPAPVVDQELRSEAALTMSLLGLMAEDQLLATRLGAKLGKPLQKAPDAPAPSARVQRALLNFDGLVAWDELSLPKVASVHPAEGLPDLPIA